MTDNLTRRSFMMKGLTTVGAAHILAQITATEMALAQEVEAVSPSGGGAGGFQNLKAQYLLDPRVSYLNHASIGTVPRSVHTAGIRYREICEENPWLYIWGGEWEEPREGVRRRAAELLGCVPDLVAITHNTTEGFNVLARGLPLSRGDEVLFSTLNHAGASVCWEHFGAERGYSVRVFDFPVEETPGLTAEDVVRLHQEEIGPNTRVLVLPHIDNIVGLRHPLRELADMAKDNGVEYVLVDGAQSAGMIPVKLSESGVDAYATSPHKWIQGPGGGTPALLCDMGTGTMAGHGPDIRGLRDQGPAGGPFPGRGPGLSGGLG
jgi:isopenicillin-N epimerase